MPAPRPDSVGPIIDPLIAAYRQAWQRIVDQELALVAHPERARQATRLAEMRRAVEAELRDLDAFAREWIAGQYSRVYSTGAVTAITQIPAAAPFTWSKIHREAVQHLADRMYGDLLDATAHVRTSTKSLIRRVAHDRLLAKAIEGKTAKQASREMTRILLDHGITSVVYSNGARFGLAGYSEMAIRTASALAYNEGSLNASTERDVKYWEVFDGIGCGWEFHGSTNAANGRIVDADEARSYPISHPNCRRSFGPRPDLETARDARAAKGSTTTGQDRAQLDAQLARGEKVVLSRAAARRLDAVGLAGVKIR